MSISAEKEDENPKRRVETVRGAALRKNLFESPDKAGHRKLIDIHLQFQAFWVIKL
jgi:hypothetical protein